MLLAFARANRERLGDFYLYPLAERMDNEEWWPPDAFAKIGRNGFFGVTVPEAVRLMREHLDREPGLVNLLLDGEFVSEPVDRVDYMDVSPKQVVSVSTALIPFLEHDADNRALFGACMACGAGHLGLGSIHFFAHVVQFVAHPRDVQHDAVQAGQGALRRRGLQHRGLLGQQRGVAHRGGAAGDEVGHDPACPVALAGGRPVEQLARGAPRGLGVARGGLDLQLQHRGLRALQFGIAAGDDGAVWTGNSNLPLARAIAKSTRRRVKSSSRGAPVTSRR